MVWWGENKSNMLQSYLDNLLSFPQLSAPSARLVAIIFTSEYETTSYIFLRTMSNNYVFGDGLLYVLNDYVCIHNTLPWLRH